MREERPIICRPRSSLECKLHDDKNKFRNANGELAMVLTQWEHITTTLSCVHGVNITAFLLLFIEGGDLEPRDFYLSAALLGLFYNEQVQYRALRWCIICRESIQRTIISNGNVFIVGTNGRRAAFLLNGISILSLKSSE